jgi:hypothetical protein
MRRPNEMLFHYSSSEPSYTYVLLTYQDIRLALIENIKSLHHCHKIIVTRKLTSGSTKSVLTKALDPFEASATLGRSYRA